MRQIIPLLLGLLRIIYSAVVTTEINLDIFSALSTKKCAEIGSNYIYDSSSYKCTTCPTNQTVDSTSVDSLGNPTYCTCIPGYAKELRKTSCSNVLDGTCSAFSCYSCFAEGKISYSDRSSCARCGNNTLGMELSSSGYTGYCSCPLNYALVEQDIVGNKLENLTCVSCPTGTQVIYFDTTIAGRRYYADRYTCQSCPDSNMQMSFSNNIYSCLCKTGYTITGVVSIGELSCLENTLVEPFLTNLPISSTIQYSSIGSTLNSLTIQHYYLSAAVRCTYLSSLEDIRYCQILANLCVLLDINFASIVCNTYIRAQLQRDLNYTNNIENWRHGLPWLLYSTIQGSLSSDIYTITTDCQQENTYKHPVSLNKDFLQYILAKYTMNGTFLGFEPLDTSLQYCQRSAPYSSNGGGSSSNTRWQFFAYTNSFTYDCDINLLLLSPQYFYELFLYDTTTTKYLPIPIRSTATTKYPDPSELCSGTELLVRRFMLYDVVSAISTADQLPEVVVYASYINILVKMVPGSDNQIYPPVASIIYSEVSTATITTTSTASSLTKSLSTPEQSIQRLNLLMKRIRNNNNQNTTTTPTTTYRRLATDTSTNSEENIHSFVVDIQYFSDSEVFAKNEETFLIVAVVLSMVMFYFRFNNWRIRHGRTIQVSALTSDIAGVNYENMRILLMVALNSYVRVVFIFLTLITWYFFVFFKLQSVASVLLPIQDDVLLDKYSYYYQFAIQVHICAILQFAYVFYNLIAVQSKSDVFFVDWEPAKVKNTRDNHQVSIWRTILVANEYAELLTKRRADVRFSLFFLGFFLLYLNLQNNATQQPSLEDLSDGQINAFLRFANNTWFWIVVSSVQYFWKYFIYERYISEPPEQIFIDFCTIAKISIFILDEKFHGYYLHCRSPHPHADGTMIELIDMLHKEEAGMTVDRAMDDGPPYVQTFECFLSTEWRVEYDKINSTLAVPRNLGDLIDQRRMRFNQRNQNSSGGNAGNGFYDGGKLWNYSNLRQGPREQSHRLRRESNTNQALGFLGFAWSSLPNENVLKAWADMMVFLRDFVENNFAQTGLKRVIKEPSYYERLLNMGPDLVVPGQPSVLVADRDYSFTKTMFLGQEYDLLMNDILLFNLFCLWFNSITLAIFLVYLVEEFVLKRFKQGWGESMISRKTMIDSRFLI